MTGKTSQYPKIHLAIDNCFASKRWTRPSEWGNILADLGVHYAEASADTEIDPLYSSPGALDEWEAEVVALTESRGVRVANLYSGHGTYATLGLAHPDATVRDRIQKQWLMPMIDRAARLGAGIGFFCHAFSQDILSDAEKYPLALEDLYRRLAELAAYAAEKNVTAGVEQMYTPHQAPWTLEGTDALLREVYARSGAPFYITIDTGHQIGQQKFQRPDAPKIEAAINKAQQAGEVPTLWLGGLDASGFLRDAVAGRIEKAKAVDAMMKMVNERPWLFAKPEDGDLYAWLERFGAHSPIIHLQQTDGNASAHRPFMEPFNSDGIVTGEKVLRAIASAYEAETDPALPPRCKDIYLTLEVFSSTADYPDAILERQQKSVEYWRKFVPKDGMDLDQLL
ncbi:MAG: TIM barrel protein [Candidatus Sumerlaeia bacterium]